MCISLYGDLKKSVYVHMIVYHFFLEKDLSNVLGIYFKCPVYSEGKSIESLVKVPLKGRLKSSFFVVVIEQW